MIGGVTGRSIVCVSRPIYNITSNRHQEPDQSGSYVLAMPALQGGFPWAVSTSVYLAPRVHNVGVLVGYRTGA